MSEQDKDQVEGEGFVIKDKRSSQISEEEAATQKDAPAPPASEEEPSAAHPENFQIDFSTFIMSLTSSAFYHLGDLADPATGKKETNLPAVQQTIDMLIMLKEKTQGNLDAEEAKLLEQLVYELQVKYVSKSKS